MITEDQMIFIYFKTPYKILLLFLLGVGRLLPNQ